MGQTIDQHVRRAHPALFGLLIFFSFIEMVQVAVLIASYNRNGNPTDSIRDRIRFLLFTSLWTLVLASVYIGGFLTAAGSFLFSIASHFAFLALTWLFWLIGAAALTGTLGGHLSCGSSDLPHCNQLNSAEAFAWINFFLATLAAIMIGLVAGRSARSGNGFGGAIIA